MSSIATSARGGVAASDRYSDRRRSISEHSSDFITSTATTSDVGRRRRGEKSKENDRQTDQLTRYQLL